MAKHGVYVNEVDTSVSAPVVASSGIPFVIGAAPISSAASPAVAGQPVLCSSWDEFVAAFGYSDNWASYNLCEFAYSHFKLFGAAPAIFVNLLDTGKAAMVEAVAAADVTVADHQAKLPIEALNTADLVVKGEGGIGVAYVKDTDYTVFYDGEYCVVELLAGTHYSESKLNIAYKKVKPSAVDATLVAASFDAIELCMSTCGVIPDLIVAPGYSKTPAVAAVMATKAAGINDCFKAKALIDIDTSAVTVYSAAATYKAQSNLTDKNEIVCWPKLKLGDRVFNYSTQLAGLIASLDTVNGGCPYESPSNKNLKIDSLVLADGTVVVQSKAQADILNAAGVVTALNFLSMGWVCWGNYTACYPAVSDPKDAFIPISRMFAWVGNSLLATYWSKLDKPMNRRLVDTIVDGCNIWLNGLTGAGYLLGGRAEVKDSENPLTDLMAGILRTHIYLTPPGPLQELDFVLEYDTEYVSAAFA